MSRCLDCERSTSGRCWNHETGPCVSCGALVPRHEDTPYPSHKPGCELVAGWLADAEVFVPAAELAALRDVATAAQGVVNLPDTWANMPAREASAVIHEAWEELRSALAALAKAREGREMNKLKPLKLPKNRAKGVVAELYTVPNDEIAEGWFWSYDPKELRQLAKWLEKAAKRLAKAKAGTRT